MGSPLERRHSGGRRLSDSHDAQALRGLLHDLGREMSTLSFLVEAVRADAALPEASTYRLELLSLEITRLLDIVRHGLNGMSDSRPEPVRVRELATQLVTLAQVAYEAQVVLAPGPETIAHINPVMLWRLLSNIVDNAARAAGAGGRVTLDIRHDGETIVDVTDDGPGFGSAPRGQASLGLDVVMSLLDSCGGALEVKPRDAGGTTVRMTLPGEVAAPKQARAHAGR